jgi:hypothetical protein
VADIGVPVYVPICFFHIMDVLRHWLHGFNPKEVPIALVRRMTAADRMGRR